MPWTMQWIPSEQLQELEGCPGPAWVTPDNASEMPICGKHDRSQIFRLCAPQIRCMPKHLLGSPSTVPCTLLLRDPTTHY